MRFKTHNVWHRQTEPYSALRINILSFFCNLRLGSCGLLQVHALPDGLIQ